MKTPRFPSLLATGLLLTQVLSSCEVTPAGGWALVPPDATFRDLQQHTFADSSSEANHWPSVDADESEMAFSLWRSKGGFSGESDVYIKPVNGRTRTQKTFHDGYDGFPAFSPDGGKLAFSSTRTGAGDIYVTNSNSGRAVRQITSSDEIEIAPSWSHDGTKLAFSRFSMSSTDWEIWIYNLETGSLTNLVPGLFAKFHPSEDTLVFQRYNESSGLYGIWTIDTEGTEEIEIVSSQDTSYINPDWSPEGDRIVFAQSEDISRSTYSKSGFTSNLIGSVLTRKANDIWMIKRDGTDLSQLTTHKGEDWCPCWGKSGRIYFVSTRDGSSNIWSVVPEFVELGGDLNSAEPSDPAEG